MACRWWPVHDRTTAGAATVITTDDSRRCDRGGWGGTAAGIHHLAPIGDRKTRAVGDSRQGRRIVGAPYLAPPAQLEGSCVRRVHVRSISNRLACLARLTRLMRRTATHE